VVTKANELNGNNLNNVRREASRHFRDKKRDYLKEKVNKLATNSKSKNIGDLCRETDECMKAENGELLSGS
jgi:hypothetical protein